MPPYELDTAQYQCCTHTRMGGSVCGHWHPHTSPCWQCAEGEPGRIGIPINEGTIRADHDGRLWARVQGTWREVATAQEVSRPVQAASVPITPVASTTAAETPSNSNVALGPSSNFAIIDGQATLNNVRIDGRSIDEVVDERIRRVLAGLGPAATPNERAAALDQVRRTLPEGAVLAEPREIKLKRLARTEAMLGRSRKE